MPVIKDFDFQKSLFASQPTDLENHSLAIRGSANLRRLLVRREAGSSLEGPEFIHCPPTLYRPLAIPTSDAIKVEIATDLMITARMSFWLAACMCVTGTHSSMRLSHANTFTCVRFDQHSDLPRCTRCSLPINLRWCSRPNYPIVDHEPWIVKYGSQFQSDRIFSTQLNNEEAWPSDLPRS